MTCRIRGRVQGVWFRGSTQDQALKLGLRGHARNLSDGSVEVLACGPPAALLTLQGWLQQGPPMARVDQVECRPTPLDEWHSSPGNGFETA